MNTPKKMLGGRDSELTRFKLMWRDSLAEPVRDFWRALFVSETPQAEIRKQLHVKLKVNLIYDSQLNAFRDWEIEQRQMDLEAERAVEEERRLIEEHPDWTKDQVRDDLLKRFYFRSRATGDSKLGLKTIAADAKLESLHLGARKIVILEKKAAQADATEKVLRDADLTPEQRAKRIKEIYGRT